MSPEITAHIQNASGFIFDMDGTIALGDSAGKGHIPLPFATETLAAVRARGLPFRVFTNGTVKAPAVYAASLRSAGFDVRDEEMMTPSSSAALWFEKQGITRVRVLGGVGVGAPLVDAGITVIGPSEKADGVEAVYTGWFREFTFPDMEAACESVWNGAILTTASHVPFFATANGRAIGASFAVNSMITSLTGKRAKVLGKPSRIAFDAAARSMGLGPKAAKNIVVVGDDPGLEMRMANNAGAVSIGMSTGLMKREKLGGLSAVETPMVFLDTLEPLLRLVSAHVKVQ